MNIDLSEIHPYALYAIQSIVIILVAIGVTKFVRLIVKKRIEKAVEDLDVDPTNYKFFQNTASTLIYTIALISILYSIPELRTYGVSLFASAGVLTIVLGFASQEALSNVVSGIFIVIFKPFRVRDILEIGTNSGEVEDITLRHTVIRNWENKRIIIPNSTISRETVINWNVSDPKTRNRIDIGISYDSDMELAKKIIREEASKHPLFIDNRTKKEKNEERPTVVIRLREYGESAIMLRAFVWTKNPIEGFDLKSDLLTSIKKRFDAEGVEIPFPYRTLVFKKDLQQETQDNEQQY